MQRRCGCVEQMERFVGFDDNAANGILESISSSTSTNSTKLVVGKFIVLLGLVPFAPFKYYRHEHSISVKREFN